MNIGRSDIKPILDNTGLSLTSIDKLRLNYLATPKILVKLAEAYCLRDDFETSIKEIFPVDITDVLFNFNSLKYYNGNWMHPIRKEIAECPYKPILERFIKRHFGGLLDKNSFSNEINWYFDQPSRKRNCDRYLKSLSKIFNLNKFFSSTYLDDSQKDCLKNPLIELFI